MAPFEALLYIILFAAGILGGFVNTLAGGGALFLVPILLLLGLPPEVANATNRVGVSLQSMLAARGLDQAKRLDRSALRLLALPFSAGALFGALSATWVSSMVIELLLYGAMGFALLSFTLRPRGILRAPEVHGAARYRPTALRIVALFALGFYAGLIQIGIGFLVVLFFLRLGYDLLEANALKLSAIVLSTLISLSIFLPKGLVAVVPALILGSSALIGAHLGVRYSLNVPPQKLQRIVFTIFFVLILLSLAQRLSNSSETGLLGALGSCGHASASR